MNNIIEQSRKYVNTLLISLENHYYHQFNHALEVTDRVIYLWKKEWLNKEQLEMLAIAWLFHDTWFLIQYDNNEFIWAKIAKNFLKSMLYPEEKIKIIERIIMATIPTYSEPKDILEEIIKDADLDYLWWENFLENANKLKNEREAIKKIKILNPDWQHWSIEFLKNHKYYTKTQKNERWPKKLQNQKYLEKLIKDLEKDWI